MKFKKFFIVYMIILILLAISFLVYVHNCLVKYENSQIDNYITFIEQQWVKSANKNKISDHLNCENIEISKYETSNASYYDGLNDLIKSSTLSHKLNAETTDKENPIYDIYANDRKIATVALKLKGYQTSLGVLTFPEWEITNTKTHLDKGIYYYDITVPSNYQVSINGNKLVEEDISSNANVSGLEDFYKYSSIPSQVIYSVGKLVAKPEIQILDENNNSVSFSEDGTNITVDVNKYTTTDVNDAMSHLVSEIDVIKFAKNWSLFLTDDLAGGTNGFETLKPYLIKNSYMWKMAYSWATSVDITFTSSHTLKNPPFTNESVTNFVIYNDTAFSCDVYLEKNMNVGRIGSQTDVMNERLYFVYYDNSWKLVNMQAITGTN